MKRRAISTVLSLCLLLTGCASWMDGYYASVEPNMEQGRTENAGITAVSNSLEMRGALVNMVENAVESRTISVENIDPKILEDSIQNAILNVVSNNPIAAYAVENIQYEIGTAGGVPAVEVTVQYNHNRSEIQRIRQVSGTERATELIYAALDELETGIVLKVSNYLATDFSQVVQDYALLYPEEVMEIPRVTVNIYPNIGLVRVVELKFTYQNSRESLKEMQRYVQPRFISASLYVSGEDEESVKFARLYAFLMETTNYTVETSITPAYSLLRHSVGDSKAFATVYASMCRGADLDCQVVTGTKAGEPWFWNIICENGVYYHVDLLQSSASSAYQKRSDRDMSGYVWDYTAYPECGVPGKTTDGTE